jgi:HEAT repeat protein
MLSDTDERVVESAIHAFGHHSIASAADLAGFAQHPSREIRLAIAMALDSDDDPKSQELLLQLMTDVDDGVRDWATFAIGAQSDADTAEIRVALRQRLDDTDDETRAEPMMGLARRGDAEVGPVIVRELLSGNRSVLAIEAAEEFLTRHPSEVSVSDALAKWRAGF